MLDRSTQIIALFSKRLSVPPFSTTLSYLELPTIPTSTVIDIQLFEAFSFNPDWSSRGKGIMSERKDTAASTPPLVVVDKETVPTDTWEIPAPDGGRQARLQIMRDHYTLFNISGYIVSFEVFQAYYTNALKISYPTISWIGFAQVVFYLVGLFSSRYLDDGRFRFTHIVGCSFQIAALFSASFCTTYWQLFLSQGIAKGLGAGLIYHSTLSLVVTYLKRKRVLDLIIIASVGATSSFTFALIA